MKLSLIALLAALVTALVSTTAAAGQPSIEVRDSSARNEFPNGLVFTLDVAADASFDDIRLFYQVAPDGVRTTAVPDCSGSTVVGCTFGLAATRRNVLIPGAEVTYFWRLTAGEVTEETPPQLVVYEDSRFEWRTLNDGNLTVWHHGSEDEARGILGAGRDSLDEISELLETSVGFPVKIFYYASAEEMRPAILAEDREGVVTLGEVAYSDTAMVSADSNPAEIARHEIAHIVVRQALEGPFDIPAWLNEGTAVFAQTRPLEGQRSALERAIESGQVLSVRSLSSASSGSLGGRVFLFYGQSWSLVQFLVDTHGQERFAELFRTFNEGASTGEALEQVYGFNQDGLENAWRDSVGLPPREAPTPNGDEGQVPPTASAPTTEAANGGSSGDDDSGAPVGVIVAIAALTVMLAGALVGAGLVIARRYR
jgi:hypothetical protein